MWPLIEILNEDEENQNKQNMNNENPSHSFTEGADMPKSVGEEMTRKREGYFQQETTAGQPKSWLKDQLKTEDLTKSNDVYWGCKPEDVKPEIVEFPSIKKVTEFQEAFNFPILEKPEIPSHERCNLRYNLLEEELEEFRIAMIKKDIVGIADALADLEYVLAGTILEFGLQERFAAIMEEVHRSNMSKACKTQKEAEDTIARYSREAPTDYHFEQRDGLFYVYRSRDMKLIKSIYYSPADIFGILHDPQEPHS